MQLLRRGAKKGDSDCICNTKLHNSTVGNLALIYALKVIFNPFVSTFLILGLPSNVKIHVRPHVSAPMLQFSRTNIRITVEIVWNFSHPKKCWLAIYCALFLRTDLFIAATLFSIASSLVESKVSDSLTISPLSAQHSLLRV